MDNLRKRAKDLRQTGNYPEAIVLYSQLWDSTNPQNNDNWLGWEYADSLKKDGQIDKAISICEQVYFYNSDFKHNNDLFAWCLFEKHFKSIKEFYSMEEEKSLFQNAELVIKLVNQNSKSPYEHVVFRIIKLLKDKPQYPASRILYWLNKIDVKLISDTPYTFTGKYGKEQESQSRKEMYYACKTKALFEKKLYSDCIICCDEAISQITLFHHDNDIWINIRKAKSIGFNGDIQTALNNLLDLQIKKDHWSLLEDISLFYYKSGDFKNCLIYALRAALTKDPIYQKVNLFYHIGLILQKNGDNDHALMHYLFSKKIREEKDWALPDLFQLT